jgi:xanthine/CO dehydrogenase XdhC/CoxF family maturation factor
MAETQIQTGTGSSTDTAAACEVAHGGVAPEVQTRTLVTVFASPVAEHLLRYGRDLGYRAVLLEPDPTRASGTATDATVVTSADALDLDGGTDVIVTDHHRQELGEMLRDVLAGPVRWIGLMGNPRHAGPHHEALAALGVPEQEIARVHRPIGLNVGSRTPPEIAISTLAGLIADRNNRPGGFTF